MPRPIQVLTVREFEKLLEEWVPARKVTEVHIHATGEPSHATFRRQASLEAMRSSHRSLGLSDLAQHLTVDPQGLLWTGRAFDTPPASVSQRNGNAKKGAFMIEVVGCFESGHGAAVDTLSEKQRRALIAVTCAVLRKFDLEKEKDTIRFHADLAPQRTTCPGSRFDREAIRDAVRAELDEPSLGGFEVPIPRQLRSGSLDRAAALGADEVEEAPWQEVPEDEGTLAEQAQLANWIDRGLVEPVDRAARGAEEEYRVLLPHLVNTSQGLLSREGRTWTTREDLRKLVEVHLTKAVREEGFRDIVFYAHGGLNSEKGALDYAKVMLPWWRSYRVYPIFLVWESSLFQAISQKRRGLEEGRRRNLGDFFDDISEALTHRLATEIWSRMKANARRCSEETTDDGEPGGLWELCKVLGPWLKDNAGTYDLKLHAIGHSTGPILLSRFVPRLVEKSGRTFSSLNYMAPAIRVDDFLREVAPLIGAGKSIEKLRMFTMCDECERADNVAKVYRKSLLYYVRQACEGEETVPILGLERDLYANEATYELFGLQRPAGAVRAPASGFATASATVEFSQRERGDRINEATEARQHGLFDNDRATMESVLRGMLGKAALEDIPGGRKFPSEDEFRRGEALDDVSARDLDDEVTPECCCCCCRRADEKKTQGGGTSSDSDGGLDDDPDADFGAGMEVEPAPSSGGGGAPAPDRAGRKPKRRALCVGIDKYPRQPLAGCVQDSENWAAALAKEGFEIKKLQNAKATRAALDKGLRDLLAGAKPGDQLVFQYAGHGSQTRDLSGDESDGFDEVMVPVDFDRGEFWLDDDFYAACRTLPKGATLTVITDCCHSGTNTRFAPDLSPTRGAAARGKDVRARYIVLDAREVALHEKKRGGASAARSSGENAPLPGVVHFAACRAKEVAYEEQGQGNFSRHALGVLGDVLGKKGSNKQFHLAIVRAFGSDKRQNPVFDKTATPALAAAPLFGGR